MTTLTTKQLKDYEDHGFVAPVDILSLEEATKIKEERSGAPGNRTPLVNL